jgi:hypothetical protein
MKALKGNMDSVGKKFAGVEGKKVKLIHSFLSEDMEPRVYIEFTDNTGLEIKIESKPDLSAEWLRIDENGDSEPEPFQREIFE